MRKIPAVLLIIAVVIPLLLSALTLFSVSGWVLRRAFYHELLGDERLYETLLAEARRQKDRPWRFEEWEDVPELRGVPAEALVKALTEVVSAGYLRDQALRMVDELFDAAEGRQLDVELALDLAPLKTSLAGEARDRFSRALAEALPVCTSGKDPVIPASGLLRCRPSGMKAERAAQLISAALPAALARFPNRYRLSPEPVRLYVEPSARYWAGFLGSARLMWIAAIVAVIAASFWIGAAFLGGKDQREITAFLGWSLFVPSVLTLASGLAVRFAPLAGWLLTAPPYWPGFPEGASREFATTLAALLRTILHTLSKGFLITGAVSIGVALGLVALSRSLEPER